MDSVSNAVCEVCTKEATYGIYSLQDNTKEYSRCKEHKIGRMVDLSFFGDNETTKIIKKYRVDPNKKQESNKDYNKDYTNVIRIVRFCIHPGCKKEALFNYPDFTYKSMCKNHKFEGMVSESLSSNKLSNTLFNELNKTLSKGAKICQYPGCPKMAQFGYSDEKVAKCCADHKKLDMINVRYPKCLKSGCTLRPEFNFPGQKMRIFCGFHKLDNMIRVGGLFIQN